MAAADEHASSMLASFSRFTQETRLLRLTTPLGANLLVECVRGEEGISRAYAFKIEALSTDAHIPLRSLIGQPALLQLLTALGRDAMRSFHGYITAADMSGANGGFARYLLTIEPWSRFLALGSDSRIFQDMDVLDIMESVFRPYLRQGGLMPAWRFDIADRSVYPKRSLTTQYRESDLAFAERLMCEEGLFYFFEHSGDPGSRSLGSHTMVVADHNGAFRPGIQAEVAFTQPGAVMKADSIDRWRTESRLVPNAVELGSWDYRIARSRHASAASGDGESIQLTSRDTPGVYAYAERQQGQRAANHRLQASQAQRHVHVCAGTVRTLAPGATFSLRGHALLDRAGNDDARTFLTVRAVHLMHNNLSAEMLDDVTKSLGKGVIAATLAADRSLSGPGLAPDARPLYRNRADLILASVPYRSSRVDGSGRLLHPRPHVHGQQTAIVVGPSGAPTHTDRDHRIKVQFHWQRGAASHSRLDHPASAGQTGAPGNETAGTWVRVATPMAGDGWGTAFIPRVGQEVLIDFLEGDIDRPVVIASLYNGRGHADAQHNRVNHGAGAATGNAPAWFPGASGAHGHPAVLSGIKTQALSDSQAGGGAYGQLVFDDSPGESRTALQLHRKAHDGAAELNLGHLRHQSDNQRLAAVGLGAELKSAQGTVLRAAQGMLLSATGRAGSDQQLDSREALAQIEQSHQLQLESATRAHEHKALIKGEPGPAKLPALEQAAHTIEVLQGTDGRQARQGAGGAGKAAAYDEPLLQLSAPGGIAAATVGDAMLVSGSTGSLSAGQDINIAVQGSVATAVVGGISLFTYGKAGNKDKPNQEAGVKLHAASGKVSCQSQSGPTQFVADKAITLASVAKSVTIAAPNKHLLLTAQGACIRLAGGNIEMHGPGTVEFKASSKELAGPKSATREADSPKVGELKLCELRAAGAAGTGDSMVPLS
ncbi:type VI secretion system Vgr family protein [Massilia niastensis]|uniref:type VI secretion system Vgr family protein n=1 Tax=Massilia niastensis TaxID=544911 RepID=UPI00037D20F8|nr:type VI secretion system Vgr family protein [Massilia niastensis]